MAKQFVEALRLRAEIGRAKYENGLMSFDDWYGIENELVDREKNLLKSQRERVAAEANYQLLLGQGF